MCRCTPDKGVTHLDVKLLRQLLNREIHPIRCAWSLRRKAQKARLLGDLCVTTNHPEIAIKMWAFVEDIIVNADDRWLDENWVIDTRWYTLDSQMAEMEACDLGRRIDQLYARQGLPDLGGYEDYANAHYYWTKYYRNPDYFDYLVELRDYIIKTRQKKATEATFNDGQSDWQPAQSQDFFTYHNGEEPEEQWDVYLSALNEATSTTSPKFHFPQK